MENILAPLASLTIVARQGGALVEVFDDLASFVEEKFPLTNLTAIAVARFVEAFPDLNTTESVSKLINIVTRQGIEIGSQLRQAVHEYGFGVVSLALDFVYEAAVTVAAETKYKKYPTPKEIAKVIEARWHEPVQGILAVCEVIVTLRDIDVVLVTVEDVEARLDFLGGLEAITGLSANEIAARLNDLSFDEELIADEYGSDDMGVTEDDSARPHEYFVNPIAVP